MAYAAPVKVEPAKTSAASKPQSIVDSYTASLEDMTAQAALDGRSTPLTRIAVANKTSPEVEMIEVETRSYTPLVPPIDQVIPETERGPLDPLLNEDILTTLQISSGGHA
ncbi:hypothetical protein F2Q68_00019039 [Brassica cretica]|uniref:Uncharacterized protein n=1 Tax=Brassica cretica TaxID=69181 RepID=A0A8S9FRV7_BRACR|nr:hypothetical protein F2Q68_00019039 [Brassica cretica]